MNNKTFIKKLIIAGVLCMIIAFLIHRFKLYDGHGYRHIVRYIKSFGPVSGLAYIIIFTIRTLILVIPYSAMVTLSGNIFGPAWGFIYSVISVFTASTLAFYIGRYMGKDFVQKIVKGKIANLGDKVEKQGFKIILIMRLSVIFPFDVLNYAMGLTKVKYKDFILGTVIGMLPETFALTFLGSNLGHPLSGKFVIAVVIFLLIIGVPVIYRRISKTNKLKNS